MVDECLVSSVGQALGGEYLGDATIVHHLRLLFLLRSDGVLRQVPTTDVGLVTVSLTEIAITARVTAAVQQSIEVVRRRIDELQRLS